MQAFARTAWISNRAARAEAQSALVSHLPDPARADAIRDILELQSETQSDVVHRLALHAPAEAAADCLAFFIKAKWAPSPEALSLLAKRASTLESGRCAICGPNRAN
jgi:hypothetical protein